MPCTCKHGAVSHIAEEIQKIPAMKVISLGETIQTNNTEFCFMCQGVIILRQLSINWQAVYASPALPEVILPTLCICAQLSLAASIRATCFQPSTATASVKLLASLPTSVQGLANHFPSVIDQCALHNDSPGSCVSE